MAASRKLVIGVGVGTALVMAGICLIRNFIRARNTPSGGSCIVFLLRIDGAKRQWQSEYKKTTNDVPTWEDLRPFFKWDSTNVPTCGEGGIYILGRIGVPPRCSVGGP